MRVTVECGTYTISNTVEGREAVLGEIALYALKGKRLKRGFEFKGVEYRVRRVGGVWVDGFVSFLAALKVLLSSKEWESTLPS